MDCGPGIHEDRERLCSTLATKHILDDLAITRVQNDVTTTLIDIKTRLSVGADAGCWLLGLTSVIE
jgi:hypothetical protein